MKRSQLFTAAAGAIAAMSSPAYALTVGEARVLSFTDQPLRVLIPVKAQAWEWRAMWASAQTYQRGLGLTATLYKPTGERTEGVIEIRSKAPITEPIVDLQITFETGHRTTVHRTPILIDVQHQSVSVVEPQTVVPTNPLEGYNTNAAPASTQGTSEGVNASTATPTAPTAANGQVYPQNGPFPEVQAVVTPPNEHVRASSYTPPPEFAPASVRASQGNTIPTPPSLTRPHTGAGGQTAKSSSANQYVVKSGDGLYAIASKHKPALWSTDETMAHIFKENRHAFAGKAYNTLKAGAVLTFTWGTSSSGDVEATEQDLAKVRTAFPELRKPENFTEPKAQHITSTVEKPFTADDARAAVLRHRMEQIQQELSILQKRAQ